MPFILSCCRAGRYFFPKKATEQGCHIFLATIYKNIPNLCNIYHIYHIRKIYQITTIYTKWP
jgi:hypothetical protein